MYSIEEVRMTDPEIAAAIEKEIKRQNDHIELIASENWTINTRKDTPARDITADAM